MLWAVADKGVVRVQSIIGLEFLKDALASFGYDHEYSKLVIDMSGQDPDDCYSKVAYEKGYNFLYYLETVVGIPAFEAWFREYIQDFTNKTLDSDEFKAHFIAHMEKKGLGAQIATVDWDGWLYGTGLGPVLNKFDTTLADAAIDLARRWAAAPDNECAALFSAGDVADFDTIQTSMFLAELKQSAPVSHAKLDAIDALYKLSPRKNGEVALWWLKLCLESNYDKAFPAVRIV
jgi:leukotriene-A4 hydrolase